MRIAAKATLAMIIRVSIRASSFLEEVLRCVSLIRVAGWHLRQAFVLLRQMVTDCHPYDHCSRQSDNAYQSNEQHRKIVREVKNCHSESRLAYEIPHGLFLLSVTVFFFTLCARLHF
jgi:hypothetical protein